MRKILRVARREYNIAVRTKGFIIALIVAPLFMGGSSFVILLTKDRVDTDDKKFAIVDRSGEAAEALVAAASMNITRIWYFTASTGGAPARIWPVIIPGRLTIPAAAMALIIGITPVRNTC